MSILRSQRDAILMAIFIALGWGFDYVANNSNAESQQRIAHIAATVSFATGMVFGVKDIIGMVWPRTKD